MKPLQITFDCYQPTVLASGWGTSKQDGRPIVDAEVARIVSLGGALARIMDKPHDYFAVMQDPEGNEFCVG